MRKSMIATGLTCVLLLPTAAMAAPPHPLAPVQESATESERESLLRELGLEPVNEREKEPETALPAPVAVEQRNIDGKD